MRKLIALFSFILLSSAATAGVIVDNDHVLEDTFLDTSTNLVWMDFGVNTGQSYAYVESQIGTGGLYEGWRLPTVEEVYTMWTNAADLDNVVADFEDPNYYGPGALRANDYSSTLWNELSDAIGYNHLYNLNQSNEYRYALGMFADNNGYIDYVWHRNYTNDNGHDYVLLYDDWNLSKTTTHTTFSTLLVRNNISVNESGVLLLLLSSLLLVVRRRR